MTWNKITKPNTNWSDGINKILLENLGYLLLEDGGILLKEDSINLEPNNPIWNKITKPT